MNNLFLKPILKPGLRIMIAFYILIILGIILSIFFDKDSIYFLSYIMGSQLWQIFTWIFASTAIQKKPKSFLMPLIFFLSLILYILLSYQTDSNKITSTVHFIGFVLAGFIIIDVATDK